MGVENLVSDRSCRFKDKICADGLHYEKPDGEVQKDDKKMKKQLKLRHSSLVKIGREKNKVDTALSDLCNVEIDEFCTKSEIDL